jgi:hypothetical protein
MKPLNPSPAPGMRTAGAAARDVQAEERNVARKDLAAGVQDGPGDRLDTGVWGFPGFRFAPPVARAIALIRGNFALLCARRK